MFLIPTSPLYGDDVSSPAPDFTLFDMNNQSHSLSSFRGKVVLVNFWASWCIQCLDEMPSLDELYRHFAQKGLVVLGITIDRDRETVLNVLNKTSVSYPVLVDKDGNVFIEAYTVTRLPTTFVIDSNGLIIKKMVGGTDYMNKTFIRFLEETLPGEAIK